MIRRKHLAALSALVILSTVAAVSSMGPSTAAPMTWSVTPTTSTGDLAGVACTSASSCMAVGYVVNADGVRRTTAQRMSGTTWTTVTTTNRGARNNVLAGVSCSASNKCVAVGYDDSGTGAVTLIETWNGTTWSTTVSPNPGGSGSRLAGVSCPILTRCVAVGSSVANGHVQPLVETWNGSTWTVSTAASPSTSRNASLTGISCATSTNCVAVGSAVSATGYLQTMVETWNGTAWTLTPSPSPNAKNDTVLNGVSCPTATSCVAVGTYDTTFGLHPTLAESWDGSSWVRTTSINVSPAGNYLGGVSCWKPGKCIAVGWSGTDTSRHTLVESLTGTTWSVSASPPAGGGTNELASASCATSTDCVAVGRSASANVEHTLALIGSTTPDVTAPAISLTTPADGAYFVVGQVVHARYGCADEAGGSGIATCTGSVPTGGVIDTSTAGPASFSVSATDYADNPATATASYRVVEPASAAATAPPGGASITTDPGGGPTPQIPVVTTLTSADAGALSVDEGAVTLTPPSGFTVYGVQIETKAPTAIASAPLTVSFDIDAAMLAGTSVDDLALLEDAASVPDCPGATALPVGIDACISERGNAPSGGGDLRITALAKSQGQWNIARGAPVPPQVAIANSSAVEGNTGTSQLHMFVSLARPSALPVSVSYATSDRSAHAGADYVSASGTLSFPPGQRVRSIPLTIDGDTLHEANETFAVTLSSPSGATLSDADGVATIVDNDPIAPAAPTVQAISASGRTQLTWSLPADNGAKITAYDIRVYDGQVLLTSKSHTVTCTQPCAPLRGWVVTGLENGKQYRFTVSARNAKGSGPAGSVTILVNNGGAGTLPGRPPAPHATAGAGRVTLTWTAPLNGSGSITSYLLTPYKNGVLQRSTLVGQGVRSFVFTHVTVGAAYTFTVRPTSTVGPGPDSPPSNAVTPT